MSPPGLTLENSIRSMRTVYVFMLLAMTMQVLVAEKFSHQAARDMQVIWAGFLLTGLMEVGIALFFRFRWLQPAAETLQEKPDDQTAIARWRVGNILLFVILDSIVLYGFAIRFLGGTAWQSLPFYIVGIALMLVWWPRRP